MRQPGDTRSSAIRRPCARGFFSWMPLLRRWSRQGFLVTVLLTALTLTGLSQQDSPAQPEASLPEGEGKKEVVTLCQSCHGLDQIVNQRKSAEEWRKSVDDMIGRGAQIFEHEVELIVDYLALHFGPESSERRADGNSDESAHRQPLPLDRIQLPPGFRIEVYAQKIPLARSLALSPKDTLYVGTRVDVDADLIARGGRLEGKVYAVLDKNRDHRADQTLTLAEGLKMPNGVAFHEGSLYVAEIDRILKWDDIESRLRTPGTPEVVTDALPGNLHHGWKFIGFGPDGLLYVPVGAPCNICEPPTPRHASILRLRPDGGVLEIFASGVRNTVGFDWHPQTGELWFTDNGRDHLGDNVPPDELNRAPREGMHFGYPYCHGKAIRDPEFREGHHCEDFTAPALELDPHVAALGMRFYTGSMFPAEFRNQIFIAEHGSWNRSKPIGYRIMLVRLEGNQPFSYEVFAEGWLQESGAWGRPVDLQVLADGSLLVSDDMAGAIYRITYEDE